MFPRLYDAQQKFSPNKQNMRQLRPADFLREDIVLLEVSVGRYWDETAQGRVTNWNSNRVYFHLEAMSLIIPGAEEADEELVPKLKSVTTASGWVGLRHNEVVGRLSGTRRVFWL